MQWKLLLADYSERKEDLMEVGHIHWLGHASFRVDDEGKSIYVDPWKLLQNAPKADIIFITHSHYDHFSPDDIAKIRTADTVIVCPEDVANQVKGNVRKAAPGQSLDVEGLSVKAIPAYNLGKKFHPKESQWIGYLIKLSNGTSIYHAGDTDFAPEMRTLRVDIALLPCGGTYTMDGKEAAQAANTFKPKLLIPMHFGDIVGSVKDAETVKSLFKGDTLIKKPER
ncbi:MAG: MBL fold metallo-hydrolase [Bacteroidota bacterium]